MERLNQMKKKEIIERLKALVEEKANQCTVKELKVLYARHSK